MSSAYTPTPNSHLLHVERERVSSIPLRGIAQIPDEADKWWKHYDEELPPRLQAECDRAIDAAMREHKLRREAIKQGIELLADGTGAASGNGEEMPW